MRNIAQPVPPAGAKFFVPREEQMDRRGDSDDQFEMASPGAWSPDSNNYIWRSGYLCRQAEYSKESGALLFQARSWRLGETTSDNMQEIRTKYEVRKNADAWIGSTREQNYSVDISNGI